ncbi:MAG: family N-acetyltransferase [Herminiimonas sp.]|nr:family N-acetyltransferase [Herminiimonas sp.]
MVPAIDETETQRLIGMVHDCGEVGLLAIGNRICGGTVFFRFGEDVSSRVIAHHPAYDTYRLGTLCCYLTICHCIEKGAKRFHLMEGHAQYKLDLLGQYRRLYHTVIYRSFWPMLRNAPEALRFLPMGGSSRPIAGCSPSWTATIRCHGGWLDEPAVCGVRAKGYLSKRRDKILALAPACCAYRFDERPCAD